MTTTAPKITMQSEGIVASMVPIDLGYDAVNVDVACALTTIVTVYMPLGESFTSSSVIWDDAAGTIVPAIGEYSDGISERHWDGTALSVPFQACIILGVAVELAADVNDSQTACYEFKEGNTSTYYFTQSGISTVTFETAVDLYIDIELTTFANLSWYSNGNIARDWKATVYGNQALCSSAVQIGLGYDPTLGQFTTACVGVQGTYYIPFGQTFVNTKFLYTDPAQQVSADAGEYSDGTVHRYWNGVAFNGGNDGACP